MEYNCADYPNEKIKKSLLISRCQLVNRPSDSPSRDLGGIFSMRESFIIYRSFYEAICDLPDTNQSEVWRAICEYSLNFNEIELTGVSRTIFRLIKPQLDANLKRYANGKRDKLKFNEIKQSTSKRKAKRKQDESKVDANVNVNENVNENVNVSTDADKTRAQKTKAPTEQEVIEFFTANGYRSDIASNAFNYYDSASWRDSRGKAVINWKQKMRGVWFKDEHKAKESNQPTYQQSSKYRPV
jgi:hypothetical protein